MDFLITPYDLLKSIMSLENADFTDSSQGRRLRRYYTTLSIYLYIFFFSLARCLYCSPILLLILRIYLAENLSCASNNSV